MPTQANLFPAPALVRRAKGAKTRFTPEQLAAVLLTIHRERFMTSEQVQRTCYTSKSPAYRDLAWLESEGHLRQVVHRARGATTPRAYAVTTKGLGAILAVRPDLPATLADREDARARRGGLTPFFLAHEFSLTEIGIAIEAAVRAMPGWTVLLNERRRPIVSTGQGSGPLKIMVQPDPQAARREELAPDRRLWVENPEGLRAFFYVELDNGTMTPDRYRQKLAKYEALAASEHPAREYALLCAAYGIEPRPLTKHPFRVLTIATDTKERRADERRRNDLLMQAVRLRSFKRFLFTTLHEAVAPGAFFGPHWLRGKEYAPIADQLALWDGPDRGQRERQEYGDAAIERMERQGLLGE